MKSITPPKHEIEHMINTHHDYIWLKKFDYSLVKLEQKYPEEVPRAIIASALQLTNEQIDELHAESIKMLQEIMKTNA